LPQYPSQIRRRHAKALVLSAIALQSRTRLAMVPARSPTAADDRLPDGFGNSIRAMMAATNSASASRTGDSWPASGLVRLLAMAGALAAGDGRFFACRAAGADVEADEGAEAGAEAGADAAAR
jgi:hypothetical protein